MIKFVLLDRFLGAHTDYDCLMADFIDKNDYLNRFSRPGSS